MKLTTIKKLRSILSLILCLNISFLVATFLEFSVGAIAYIPSESMTPTLCVGDRLICTTQLFSKQITRGDIVVFKPEDTSKYTKYIKRVIGLPGDHIRISRGKVIINGEVLDEPYVKYNGDYTGSFVVPDKEYLLLGDNRADSLDSRFWENPFVKEKDIKYIAHFRLFPFTDIGFIN